MKEKNHWLKLNDDNDSTLALVYQRGSSCHFPDCLRLPGALGARKDSKGRCSRSTPQSVGKGTPREPIYGCSKAHGSHTARGPESKHRRAKVDLSRCI